ncbi:GcrA family cell cycle regulator [Mesorhizobium sp. B2-3-12]|uniref:GcrA family cell cycle regulator n=1 Tax=Mesorhizobium sp. B2-3-12 TaxID=2589952 RepID=UPI001128B3AE|nr:GcrA family cell cycle regulator [Mesorhizobium sp. B2-3-12]TPL86150.1 GcrA cell cycle regulator [Mesorhizobium sp. B2-3-12]
MASYSDSELQAIAAWLKDGLSASRIAAGFSQQRGSPVSRNAIIGIVHRNAMLGAIGFANGKGLPAAVAVAARHAATAERKAAAKTPAPAPPAAASKPATQLKRDPSPARPRLFHREAGLLVADGQTYRFKVPVRPRAPIGRQPHGVAMRFIDCLFNRCRAPLDLTLEDDPQNDAPGGRPGQEMLCCGMRTRGMKSYCTYHQARFQRRV